MKEKKKKSNWYVAATHWLTSIFAATIGGVVILFLIDLSGSDITFLIATFLILPLTMWLAVIYSVKYLRKTYIIENTKKVVILSTIYLVVISGGFRLYNFLQTGIFSIEHASFVVSVVVFYFASKKYLSNITKNPTNQT